MKRIDIFCASQASTAICMSMDQPSSSSSSSSIASSSFLLGGKAIDRHNPIIRDQKRTPRTLPIGPCTSQQQPISPKPYHLLHKGKKTSAKSRAAAATADQKIKKSAAKVPNENIKKPHSGPIIDAKKSSGPIIDAKKSVSSVTNDISRRSWAKAGDLFTPPGSTRYLLGDDRGANFLDGFSDYDQVLQIVPAESIKTRSFSPDEPNSASCSSSKPSSSSKPEKPTNQVVVLRVSLHCKGCEGKVRKHLSRMEGVASFNIDFAAKKVTVVGEVTPLGVLASVSKVKNAQFWTAPTVVSSSTEVKK